MPEINLQVKPVAVKVLRGPREDLKEEIEVYQGVSYCDAVRRATGNEELLIRPGSISTCQWSPVILGLKKAENNFERRLAPRMEDVWGYYISSLLSFSKRGLEPDIMIIRGSPELLRLILSHLGWPNTATSLAEELDKSALGFLRDNRFALKTSVTMGFNKALFAFSEKEWWHNATRAVFSRTWACNVFDRIISSLMADMSICRNSTVIPYRMNLANASHFCSGGVSWGLNRPDYMTAGIPFYLFRALREEATVRWHSSNRQILDRSVVPPKDCGCPL